MIHRGKVQSDGAGPQLLPEAGLHAIKVAASSHYP